MNEKPDIFEYLARKTFGMFFCCYLLHFQRHNTLKSIITDNSRKKVKKNGKGESMVQGILLYKHFSSRHIIYFIT